MSKGERDLQSLGVFVHGVLSAFHLLGLVYNFKRKNRFDCLAHASALAYDLYALRKHVKHVRRLNEREEVCGTK